MMRFLGVLSYEIVNAEKLGDARLVLANHPSLLDVVFLISLMPNANCIVKGHLTRNFFIRGPVKAAGYIVNETAEAAIADADRAFRNKQCLIIFPEGTRTTQSEALKLKRGAANVAIRTGSDITPVLIYCDPTTLTKNERWYQIPPRRMHFRILVKDKISIEQYSTNISPSKGARMLTRDLTEYFEKELRANG
jgi:1-acyl-sn-glycerol-3-phosphate acyltransferase